jgi:hypothetical protein
VSYREVNLQTGTVLPMALPHTVVKAAAHAERCSSPYGSVAGTIQLFFSAVSTEPATLVKTCEVALPAAEFLIAYALRHCKKPTTRLVDIYGNVGVTFTPWNAEAVESIAVRDCAKFNRVACDSWMMQVKDKKIQLNTAALKELAATKIAADVVRILLPDVQNYPSIEGIHDMFSVGGKPVWAVIQMKMRKTFTAGEIVEALEAMHTHAQKSLGMKAGAYYAVLYTAAPNSSKSIPRGSVVLGPQALDACLQRISPDLPLLRLIQEKRMAENAD